MKKNYIFALVCLGLLSLGLETKAQILTPTYPSPAQSITRGLDQSLLTVDVAFTSTCNNDTITVCMPPSVTYVTGSVTKTGGTQTISEGDISDLRKPQFVVSNVTGTGDIRFTILREAACGTDPSGKDTIQVVGSCGTATEASGALNTYNLFSPVLSVAPAAPISGAVIQRTYTRNISITNGGNGDADTVYFNIIYTGGGLENTAANAITANGTSFSPYKTSGDTLFYKFFGATLFGGDNILTNGESIAITEPIRVTGCNTVTTYEAGWGTADDNVCVWASNTASVSMATGVPNISVTWGRSGYVDKCTPYTVTTNVTNNGSGNDTAAALFNIEMRQGSGFSGFGGHNFGLFTLSNFTIGAQSLTPVNGTYVDIDFDNLFTTDPDGPGGLEDLDGDGFFDDLARGAVLTYSYTVTVNCVKNCGQNISQDGVAMLANFEDMCDASRTTGIRRTSGEMYIRQLGISGNGRVPANIQGGTPFRISLSAAFPNYSEAPYFTANRRYRWGIVLPTGFSVSGAGNPTYNGAASTFTQNLDTVFIQSTNATRAGAAIDLVYTCGTSGTKTINYFLEVINDITTGCRCQSALLCNSVNTLAICPGPCPAGPTTYIPTVRRVDESLGWTDNTMATRQIASNISAFDLSKALYLDTIQVTGSALQNSVATNLHQEMTLTRTGTTNRLTPLSIDVTIIRGGATVATYTVTTATDNSSGSSQIIDWDLSSGLPAGSMAIGDSVYTLARYVVADNATLPQQDIQTGGTYTFYSIIAGVREGCNSPVPEMYLVGTTILDGRNPFSSSYCNPVFLGGSGSNLARRFNSIGTNYANEFRPVFYIDSFIITFPANYEVLQTTLSTSSNVGVVTPDVINGNVYTYRNPGTWRPVEMTVTNAYGGRINYQVRPTCKATSGTLNVKTYIKDFYYANATKPVYPAAYQYVLNGGSSNTGAGNPAGITSTVTYNASSNPVITTQNITGDVQGVDLQHSWDIEMANTGLEAATNAWVAIEPLAGTGITIDSVQLLSSGATLTRNNYGSGKSWYPISAAGIASGSNETVRIFFKYSNCGPDSIAVKTGWSCANFPSPDPDTDTTVCSLNSVFAKVVPSTANLQISILRQPGNGSPIDLCTTDSVLVRANSAGDANVISPFVDIFPPTGLTISGTIPVEYPIGSGLYENLSTTSITGGVRVDLSQHTGIGATGIPGLANNPAAPGRQAKLKIDFTTDCNHTSGSSIAFRRSGLNPCGSAATGSSQPPVRSNGVDINGASTPGGAGATLAVPVTSLTCGQTATVPFTVTPVSAPTQAGDTAIYTLPANISYGGNFTTGANCASCAVSTTAGPAGTTIIKVALQTGVTSGNALNFGFDISANTGNGCGSETITAEVKRNIPPLSCMGTPCPSSSVIIGTATSSSIDVTFPDLSITAYTGDYVSYSPAYTYRYTGTIQNSSALTAISSGTSTVLETWFDMDKNNAFDPGLDQRVHVQTITDAIAANNGTTNFIDTFSWSDGVNPPDPTRGMFTVIRNSTSPNCMCSPMAMSPMVAGLPVSWSKFTATKQWNNDVLLNWTTEMERNSSHFEVQRKFAYQARFKTLANVNAAGTTFDPRDYSYTDKHNETFSNIVLYRIKQVDLNGAVNYSSIRTVYYNNLGEYFSIAPNPAQNKVAISTSVNSAFQYKLMDAASHIMADGRCTDGKCEIDLSNISAGIYFVSVKNELGVSHIEKLVIAK